jgi:transposase InsO family protein
MRRIEPGKPSQNAYIESFNGRLRDECLNKHGVPESRLCPGRDRSLAAGIQRGASKKGIGWWSNRNRPLYVCLQYVPDIEAEIRYFCLGSNPEV